MHININVGKAFCYLTLDFWWLLWQILHCGYYIVDILPTTISLDSGDARI